MIERLDFSLPAPMLSALLLSGALPIFLAVVARVPRLAGRNALQFFIATLLMIATFLGVVVARMRLEPVSAAALIVSLMAICAVTLFYLEVWSLMSRGYTLGLVLTLYRAEGALTEEALAQRYRGGEGLAWIMRHRIAAMIHTGLVRHDADVVTLTVRRGLPVVWLYRTSVSILGLRQNLR